MKDTKEFRRADHLYFHISNGGISHRANLLKSDATLSEWRALVSWAIENMKEIK